MLPALLISAVLLTVAFILLGIEGIRRAPGRQTFLEREPRGLAMAAWTALVLLPWELSAVLARAWEAELPVTRPPDPFASGEPWNLDLDFGGLWLAAGVVAVAIAVGVPVVAYLVGARRSARRGPPGGTRVVALAAVLAAVVLVLGAARAVLGGVVPEAFETFGALVPDAGWAEEGPARVERWRVERVVSRALGSGESFRAVWVGETLASDSEHYAGSDCCGALAHAGGTRMADGVAAWWAFNPVMLRAKGNDLGHVVDVTVHPVVSRDPAIVPRGRPQLHGALSWAPASDPSELLVRAAPPEGRPMFIRMSGGRFADVWAIKVHEVGLLLRLPWWPLVLLVFAAAAAVLLLRRYERTRWTESFRFVAAWLLMAPTWTALFVWAPYF